MVRVDIEERIGRPIEEVFDRLVDIPRYPEWMSRRGIFISCTQDDEGPVGVGTPYTDRIRLGTVHGEVVAFERPTKVVFQYTARMFGRTMMRGWPGYTLSSDGEGGTRVHHVAEGHLYGPFRGLRPLIQLVARTERRQTLAALKRSLELRTDRPG